MTEFQINFRNEHREAVHIVWNFCCTCHVSPRSWAPMLWRAPSFQTGARPDTGIRALHISTNILARPRMTSKSGRRATVEHAICTWSPVQWRRWHVVANRDSAGYTRAVDDTWYPLGLHCGLAELHAGFRVPHDSALRNASAIVPPEGRAIRRWWTSRRRTGHDSWTRQITFPRARAKWRRHPRTPLGLELVPDAAGCCQQLSIARPDPEAITGPWTEWAPTFR